MKGTLLTYQLPDCLGILQISEDALAHFEANKQHGWLSCEAGGQLFARIEDSGKTLKVVGVTGPRPTDKRTVFGYVPDRTAEREEIAEHFSRGLHFVGDWHTHRQDMPLPSGTDLASMRDMVRKSNHDLAGFIMIIVGRANFPDGLYVSFHSDTLSQQLALVT